MTPVADIDVPATLQATIGSRIDRLDAKAKRTLHAAAVIGARFSAELIGKLTPDSDLAGLVEAELIERIPATTRTEYAFRHPLIQKVAYDSQLRADRSKLHRRLASSIEPVDENAALDRNTVGGGRRLRRGLSVAHAGGVLVQLSRSRCGVQELAKSARCGRPAAH